MPPFSFIRSINGNPALDFPSAPSYRKYGFEVAVVGEWWEGAAIGWTFHLPDGSFSIENYHLGVAAHEEAAGLAGFRGVRWHGPQVSPDGEAAHGSEFWSCLLGHCPVTFLECVR